MAILLTLLTQLPMLIQAGVDVTNLIENARTAVASGSTDPTSDQWAAVDAELAMLTAQLNKDPA